MGSPRSYRPMPQYVRGLPIHTADYPIMTLTLCTNLAMTYRQLQGPWHYIPHCQLGSPRSSRPAHSHDRQLISCHLHQCLRKYIGPSAFHLPSTCLFHDTGFSWGNSLGLSFFTDARLSSEPLHHAEHIHLHILGIFTSAYALSCLYLAQSFSSSSTAATTSPNTLWPHNLARLNQHDLLTSSGICSLQRQAVFCYKSMIHLNHIRALRLHHIRLLYVACT